MKLRPLGYLAGGVCVTPKGKKQIAFRSMRARLGAEDDNSAGASAPTSETFVPINQATESPVDLAAIGADLDSGNRNMAVCKASRNRTSARRRFEKRVPRQAVLE